MNACDSSRRRFIWRSSSVIAPAILAGAAPPTSSQQAARPPKVVCVGGHPDDPESGCGGTLARFSELGHRVTIIYLTRGEASALAKSDPFVLG